MKKQLKKILDTFGLEVSRNKPGQKYGKSPGYHRLDRLPNIKTIIDVGIGHSGSPFLYKRNWNPYFICIDPLNEAKQFIETNLKSDSFTFFQCAAGSEQKQNISFYVSSIPSRTSLLDRTNHDDASTPKELRYTDIKRLDDLIDANEITHPSLLKIDIEGGEMECLKGGEKLAESTNYILQELPLTYNYSQTYKFSEIIVFLANLNFQPLMVLKAGNNNLDLLFCKEDDPIRSDLAYGNQK